jgi:hypothetical protein
MMMSAPNAATVLTPSWKTALGLFAVMAGYLVALVGIVFYAWGGLHEVYHVPTVLVSIIGLLVVVAGGAMVWTERA